MRKKLEKIVRKPLSLEVEEHIRHYIIANNIKVGDTLPGEIKLASMMGISRSVVREALSGLRRIGLIESKKKKGIVVREVNPARIVESCIPFFTINFENLEDLSYFRYILEVGATELAILRGTEEAIDNIKKAAEFYSTKVKKGLSGKRIDPADEAFHIAILKATGNKLLSEMSSVIIKYFKKAYGDMLQTKADLKRVAKEHEMIAEAIKEKDVKKSLDLMKRHLETIMDRIEEYRKTKNEKKRRIPMLGINTNRRLMEIK